MVSLYTHKRVTIGAIVTTMIATSGDEAFVMLAMFPKTAIIMFAGLAVAGILTGWFTDAILLKNRKSSKELCCDFDMHSEWEPTRLNAEQLKKQWKHLSSTRAILVVSISIFVILLVAFKTGLIEGTAAGNHHFGWEGITLLTLLLAGLFIISTVSDHFLDEHLWEHVLKQHIPKIFFWTLGALGSMAILNNFVNLDNIIADNLWIVLFIAAAIGFIPESGPHLVFVSLFAAGKIPLSILIASSMIQDGHGMVPLLAHSRKDFISIKLINAGAGLATGALMLLLGW
jgi:uncharacterized membrane protein